MPALILADRNLDFLGDFGLKCLAIMTTAGGRPMLDGACKPDTVGEEVESG